MDGTATGAHVSRCAGTRKFAGRERSRQRGLPRRNRQIWRWRHRDIPCFSGGELNPGNHNAKEEP